MSERRQEGQPELLFVYDRVCTKGEKDREIGREYGVGVSADNPSREQTYRGSFADEGHRRAVEASRDPSSSPSRPGVTEANNRAQAVKKGRRRMSDTAWFGDRYSTRTGTWNLGASRPGKSGGSSAGARAQASAFSAENPKAYTYRPEKPEGGEAAAEKHGRQHPEWFADLFTSPEEKGREELRQMRKAAAARQKLREYRHALLTALILTAVLALAIGLTYRILFVIDRVDVSGSAVYDAETVGQAAGIEAGDRLYSFRSEESVREITFRLPWIRSAEITRSAPKGVSIVLTDDEARYAADIWGDTVVLSPSLKVLSVLSEEEEAPDGLIRLILPPVKKSVAGRPLAFESDRAERYIRNVLNCASESGLTKDGLLEEIDLSSEYEIRMKACGLYDLKCAGESDMTAKLRMAYEIIVSGQLAEGIPASFDLTAVDPVTVIYDFSAAGYPD
jgi:hypothetical protein